jgi:ATP-dependent RNA helicase DeaD
MLAKALASCRQLTRDTLGLPAAFPAPAVGVILWERAMMTCGDRVPDALARALIAHDFLHLTPVQRAVLAVVPRGRDMLVSSATGTGKTVAFGLALAGRLLDGAGRLRVSDAPRALVVTPTRELAQQVQRELAWLYAHTGARIVCCTGGMDMRAESARLRAGCEIVVGSPGRLRDHVERGGLVTAALESVVIDEADDMLDMGFRDELEFLLAAAAPDRQTLMFSATISRRVETLAQRFQRDAARIDATGREADAPPIRYEGVAVAPNDRENAIVNILRFHEAQGAIVFCGKRETVAHLASRLDNRGFNVVALSGALPQRERAAAMAALRDGRARVCVATDLAARGLDLPGVELVIHADLPHSVEALKHRSGRTGRAGRAGLAVLVVPHPQRRRALALAARAGLALDWTAVPGAEEILERDEARMFEELAAAPEASPEEAAAAARLIARLDPERVAVAYLRRKAAQRPAPEILIGAASDYARLARPRLEGGVWFVLNCGRASRAEVRWILPLLCRLGRVTKTEIGRILVGERETRFEISLAAAEGFAEAVARTSEAGIEIRRAGDAGGLAGCAGVRMDRRPAPERPGD